MYKLLSEKNFENLLKFELFLMTLSYCIPVDEMNLCLNYCGIDFSVFVLLGIKTFYRDYFSYVLMFFFSRKAS